MTKLLIFAFAMMILISIGLWYCYRYLKTDKQKDQVLRCAAVVTVVLHYSSLWVDYLLTGSAKVDNTMLFPIYPCNICMWLLLIVSLLRNKKSFIYKTMVEFLAIAGTVCGLIGLFANEIFIATPDFSNWHSLKGLLSHSTMIFGTLFLLTQGYVQIRVKSLTLSTFLGLMLFAVDGIFIILLFKLFNLPEVNAMYILDFPFDIKGGNFITLGILGVVIAFIIANIYELLNLKREERWYYHIKNK